MADKDQEVLLSVRNLKQHFKVGKNVIKAVHNVSFDIYKGEVFGLVGESGSGKSTTGRSIIKLYQITDGEIFFEGKRTSVGLQSIDEEIAKLKKNKKTNPRYSSEMDRLKAKREKAVLDNKTAKNFFTKIQMIFQDPMASLNPRMKVLNIISEALSIHFPTMTRSQKDQKVFKFLEIVGLTKGHAHRYPHEFSGGQRQRIGIARALITNPKLVIADEAISALDVSIQAQVVNLMNDLKEEFGLTYLFIAHDLSMVKYISDRIGVMHKGRMVELGTSDEIYHNPIHPYTKSLLSAIPHPDPNYERTRERLYYDKDKEGITYSKGTWRNVTDSHFILATDDELEKWTK